MRDGEYPILDADLSILEEHHAYELELSARSTPPEQRLFQARIMQFLQDSLANHPKRTAGTIRTNARKFFNARNTDFLFTCECAGWPPPLALAMFTKIQQTGTVPRLVKQFAGTSTQGEEHARRPAD